MISRGQRLNLKFCPWTLAALFLKKHITCQIELLGLQWCLSRRQKTSWTKVRWMAGVQLSSTEWLLLSSDLNSEKIPAKNVPYRTYNDENYYSLILTTPPIFSNIPSAAVNVPKITRGSLGSRPCSHYNSCHMIYLHIFKVCHLLVLVSDSILSYMNSMSSNQLQTL